MDRSSPNLEAGNPCRLTSFFPIVYLILCSSVPLQRYFRSKFEVGLKKRVLPKPVCGKHPGDLGPNFQIAVISESCVNVCPSLFEIHSVTSEIRRRKKKKEIKKKHSSTI